MLEDHDGWVQLNAAGALSMYTGVKDDATERLQAVNTDNKQLQERISESIRTLKNADMCEMTRNRFQQSLDSIHTFVANRRQPH